MAIPIFKKNYLFLIVAIILIGTDSLGLFLLQKNKNQLATVKSYLSLQTSLKSEGISPTLINETRRIDEAFPNEQEVIQFISDINKYKSQFEKFSLTFETEEPKTNGKYKYLPFILEISGNSEKISQFLTKLWGAPFILEVTSLEIKKQPASLTQTNVLMKANIYVQEAFGGK